MKYTIAFVIAAFLMSALLLSCRATKKNYDAIQRVGTSEVDLDLLTKHKWRHIRTKDSYDGIWHDIDEENTLITFDAAGNYTEDKPGNPTHDGTFSLQDEKGLNIKHSGNKATLQYDVAFLDKKKLVLAIQGRHGDVFYVYEPAN